MFFRLFAAADVLFTATRVAGAVELRPQADPSDFVRLSVPPKVPAPLRQG
ncbi:hypothetical protein Rumeso_00663 [Rubellimicrobium mesophilum DSM 19309]|uniref:Uncharacterized protein n=1 Tax=Rubellimicrobium mesophilum DSM 19309 TaxID=442562 RepID=A0A017HTA9_9RHOB|nr:hypothetical protein [Rubellimicrobium mesophilum]EYD77747.1 hypothetical protein Rumeso_00663 [Rubellimicrobium mesophilum DSM 19309]